MKAVGEQGLGLKRRISDLGVGDMQGDGGASASPPCLVGACEQARAPRCGLEPEPGRWGRDGVAVSIAPHISPWRKEWANLASRVRRAGGNLFWELFAGVGILTRAFEEEAWHAGPPIDIMYTEAFNLLDPGFFMVVLGLILEGWVAVLHLGPPCSSFSMAFNRFSSQRIRSSQFPAGLENLTDAQEAKVRLGNELAQVALSLARAQMKAGRWFQLEQPASSLMLHLPSFKDLIKDTNVFMAVRCVCADGAPWMKPTAIIANSKHILNLNARCPGCKSHISLQGKSPDGRSWTAVASPYWPAFARLMAKSWAWARGQSKSSSSSHLAGLRVSEDADMTNVLNTSGFNPSGKRARETVAANVGAGSQPVRRALPQLIPDELGPMLHLKVAHQTKHPFLVSPKLTDPMKYAKMHFINDVDAANSQREEMLNTIKEMALALKDEEKEIMKLVDPFIAPIVGKRAFCFMRELAFCSGFPDHLLMIDLTLGMPAMGWSCRAPTMKVRIAEPQVSLEDLKKDAEEHNTRILKSTKPSKDSKLDMASWLKTMEEVDADVVIGPFRHFDEIPFKKIRLLRRFGTWEMHGEQTEPKVRNIDDALEGGQNAASGSQHTHIPTNLDLWINQLRMAQELCPKQEIKQFASDFSWAYKQVAGDPSLAGLAVICQWSPKWRRPVFFVGRTQFFGGKSCPVNFARVPDFWCYVMASMGAMGMSHCVDDMLVAERASTISSGYRLWRETVALAGWDVPDKKSPPPSSSCQILGVMSDLTHTPHNPPEIKVTQKRVEKLLEQLKEVLTKQRLGSGLAGKLWGRLQFASTQAYGRTGRAMLRALNRRQHEGGRHGLNTQLHACLQWWLHHLPILPSRPVPIHLHTRKVMVSYSDGEGSNAQVGIALWEQGQSRARAGVVRIPDTLRTQWDHRKKCNRFNDIYEVEAVGPLLILHNFGEDLTDCLWLHFIDNAGALSSLVRGGSSVESGDRITGLTWSHIVQVGCMPWFDRVDSASNPTDGLSRERLLGPWTLEPIHLPGALWDEQMVAPASNHHALTHMGGPSGG